jgi:hypothetical protein
MNELLGLTAGLCGAMVGVLRKWLITLVQNLARLHINDLLHVPIIVFVNGPMDADELAKFVAVLYAGVCVEPQLLGARE